jgi:hypothetical protein
MGRFKAPLGSIRAPVRYHLLPIATVFGTYFGSLIHPLPLRSA